ncbi:zinc import ATP-binding protein [Candidatus Photodesmus blepharus]|uniref:Zinc import ATP-binding protein n=1 Tax=Candidatus Photodesmus blepharonis TaxID=1179155 RepID=A0A084CNB9_9GAMM|nr:zinc import ATP-binding protein [Candidatus Photodesmus blepharus]
MTTLVELRNIQVCFGKKNVLDSVTLTLKKGKITTLIGPNGAGKSTLIKVLLGLQPMHDGEVIKKRKLRVGYVPQKTNLNDLLPLNVNSFLKLAGKFSEQEILEALKLVGAEHLTANSIHKLSGGENRRVLIARALLQRPNLLVLDEPAQGVDVQGQIDLYGLIDSIRHRFNCAVFMASHDLYFVMAKTDKVICLHHHICCSGTPENITKHPNYIALFGQYQSGGLSLYHHQHDP